MEFYTYSYNVTSIDMNKLKTLVNNIEEDLFVNAYFKEDDSLLKLSISSNDPQIVNLVNDVVINNESDFLNLTASGYVVSADNMEGMVSPKFKLYTIDVVYYLILKLIKSDIEIEDIKEFGVLTSGDVVVTSGVGSVDLSLYTTNRTEAIMIQFYDSGSSGKKGRFKKKINRTQTEYEELVAKIFEDIPVI